MPRHRRLSLPGIDPVLAASFFFESSALAKDIIAQLHLVAPILLAFAFDFYEIVMSASSI